MLLKRVLLSLPALPGLAFVGLAGCTPAGGPSGPTPTASPAPTPTASPSATPSTLSARLIIQDIRFDPTMYGDYRIVVKNDTGATVSNLDQYQVMLCAGAKSSLAEGRLATASFRTSYPSGPAITSLADQATVSLDSPFGVDAAWASGGGAIALFKSPATSSATLTDFFQWGAAGSRLEPLAVAAGLWAPGTTVASVSEDVPTLGATASIITEGATGSANWRLQK